MTVTWDAVAGATSYEVYYNTTDNLSTATLASDANNTDTTCTITGLTNGQTYYVWVKAKNSAGTSEASPVASGVPASSGPWTGTVSGTSANDGAFCIAVGTGGKIYIGGYTYGSFPLYTNPGGVDGFITEMDSSGSIIKNYQSQASGDDVIRAMVADSAGNIIVTGYKLSKPFVAKYNPDLSSPPLWSVDFGTSISNVMSYAVTVDGSDNIYVAGRTQETLNGQTPTGGNDAFVIKFNSGGVTQWTKVIGSSADDVANGVATDTSGNVYITGDTLGTFPENTSAGGHDTFVAKLTQSAGGDSVVSVAVKQFGTADYEYASSVAVDSANKAVWVTGTTSGNLAPLSTVGMQDYFLAKFNSNTLALELAKQSSSTYIDIGLAIALDAVGNVYIAGSTEGTLDATEPFVPGVGNAFLIKYNAIGNLLWTRQLGSASGADYTAVAVSGTNIFVAGRNFGGTFDGKAAIGGMDAVVVKYDGLGVKQ